MRIFYLYLGLALTFCIVQIGNAEEPVTINFTGSFVAASCRIDSSSVSQNIDLGQHIDVSTLQAPGSGTQWVTFGIKLVDCPAGTSFATVQFHGNSDSNNPDDLYLNTGTAKNVAVEFQGTGGENFGNGKSYTAGVSTNGVTFNLRTRAYTTNGGVTAGTIISTVTATFTYQ